MKKYYYLLVLIPFFLSPPARLFAQASKVTYSAQAQPDSVELNLMGGPVIDSTLSGNSASLDYGPGYGADVSAFYMMGGQFGIGLQTGYYNVTRSIGVSGNYTYTPSSGPVTGTYSGAVNFNLGSLEFLPMLKYKIGGKKLWFYLLGGGGLSLLLANGTAELNYSNGTPPNTPVDTGVNSSKIEPMVQGGGGLAIKFNSYVNLFIEAKYALVFDGSGSFSYIPVNLGVNLNL